MAFSFQAYTRCLQHHLRLLSPLTDETCVSRTAMRTKYFANIRNSTQDICILAIFEYARAYFLGDMASPLGFLVAQKVKNLRAMQEIWVRSLGWEDPLEKGMATRSSILAWRIPWSEEPDRLQSMGLQRAGHNLVTLSVSFFLCLCLSPSVSLSHTHLVF